MSVIVLIEDSPPSARLAARILRRKGHDVLVADDGEMGLMTVLENHPDLVLVDLGLPDLDGQTIIALLRQEKQLQSVPIIAFTAWPEERAREMAKVYGCDGVITKPIDTHKFGQQIEVYLKQTHTNP